MAEFNGGISEVVHKAFLAGVGAVAYGAEKSGELVDTLVKKGELTVEQGKELNAELTQKAKETVDSAQDSVLKARMSTMSPEEREAFIERAKKLNEELASKDAEPEVEAEAEVVDADVVAEDAEE